VFAEFQPPTTPTSVSVTSSASPSTYGESITFTASVSPASSPAPSGTISFYSGNSLLGSAAVSSGTANFTSSNLPAGTYLISASYSGDGHYGASIGAPISQTVSPAALAVTASSASMTSGGTIPAFTYSMTGFVNGDTQSSATSGAPTLTSTAAAQPKPGIYAINPAVGTLTAANYTFAFVNGVLSVNTSMTATTGQSATIPFVLGVGATDTASPITFSCAGLPSGSQCVFSPSSVPAPVTAPVTVTLSISTSSAASVPYRAPRFPWTLALAVPVMLLFPAVTVLRRRRTAWLLATAAVVVGLAIAGCSSTKTVTNTVTDSYLSVSAVDASGNVLGSFNVQLNVGP
jgi:Bacterial Ig-like domain (group 3)/MBG domain (YGX type)